MRPPATLAVALALARLGAARQGSSFDPTPAEASAHACGAQCQSVLRVANAADLEAMGASFDYDFYARAANQTPATRPGDVLKLEPVDWEAGNRTYKDGIAAYRFQYATVDLDGSVVPASAFVAFPFAAAMAGFGSAANGSSAANATYRLVAYAHGTSGIFAGCAPSNGPSMYDYDTWQALTARGYAVVATDYAGLGTNATTHKYCSFAAHAADVVWSVAAARRLFGARLSREWMVAGHSQGGGAAWKVAESPLVRNDSGFLGAVALSPATRVIDMMATVLGNGTANGTVDSFPGYVPFLPIAIERAVPSYRETLLSDNLRQRVALGVDSQLCIGGLMGLTFDMAARGEPIFNVSGLRHDLPTMLQWQAEQAPSLGARSPAPILVVQGEADTSVLAATTQEAWRGSCAAGNTVHLSLYPGVEHSPLPAAAAAEWLAWIDWRFAGGRYPRGSGCSHETKPAFSSRWTKTSPELRMSTFLGGSDNSTAAAAHRRWLRLM